MNLKVIAQAWYNKFFGDNSSKILAAERRKVCDTCEKNIIMLNINVCAFCHCPLAGKTFTKENSCPLKKWRK